MGKKIEKIGGNALNHVELKVNELIEAVNVLIAKVAGDEGPVVERKVPRRVKK